LYYPPIMIKKTPYKLRRGFILEISFPESTFKMWTVSESHDAYIKKKPIAGLLKNLVIRNAPLLPAATLGKVKEQ